MLDDLKEDIRSILRENFIGFYLQGSFAVGDFDEHSDVDFIVVIKQELAEGEVGKLQSMHGRIFDGPVAWAQHLEGSYFPKEILRDRARRGSALWYLDNGSRELELSDHCNTLLVRWVVRKKGVTLAGPPPESLVDPIPVGELRDEIMSVIQGWGQEILDDSEHFNNRFYQGFITLNFCRMLHDFHRGYPGSKREGAEWAKANLDPVWGGLIDRAWGGRPKPEVSVRQRADAQDYEATLAFVRHIMEVSPGYG